MLHAFLLSFTICSATVSAGGSDFDRCEEGEVRARSCEAAEAFIRAGMKPGQTLFIVHCGEAG